MNIHPYAQRLEASARNLLESHLGAKETVDQHKQTDQIWALAKENADLKAECHSLRKQMLEDQQRDGYIRSLLVSNSMRYREEYAGKEATKTARSHGVNFGGSAGIGRNSGVDSEQLQLAECVQHNSECACGEWIHRTCVFLVRFCA
jgi:hypothetical protein